MDDEKKSEAQVKEEKEDLKDISRSEDEGFGIISEGYRCKEAKIDLPNGSYDK